MTDVAAAAAQVARLPSLDAALRWGREQRPAWSVVDVVVQDEFTHDVILGIEAGAGALVLDCT